MGCMQSRIEGEEAVRRSRERKKLMKQLLTMRAHLAETHFAYLKSLRDTGATLRQFIEVESINLPTVIHPTKSTPLSLNLPPAPPPLPPSPPPLPQFSPLITKLRKSKSPKDSIEDTSSDTESETDSCVTPKPPPPPPPPDSNWEFWDDDPFTPPVTFNLSSPVLSSTTTNNNKTELEEQDFEETNTEFFEEGGELGKGKVLGTQLGEDSMDADVAMVMWRSKRNLVGIVKEIDEYFLKAAAGGRDVATLLELDKGQLRPWEFEGKRGKSLKSAKVFTTLSFNRSFRSPQFNYNTNSNLSGGSLYKLYEEEQRLYKQIKEEESLRLCYKKYTLSLEKMEARHHDLVQAEKMREKIEELQTRIISLQDSVNATSLSIAKLRDDELFPQLIELCAGLAHMWRVMHECHQVQSDISQQPNLIENLVGNEPTTSSHRDATWQLESEVATWHSSFLDLINSQREYLRVLSRWIQLAECINGSAGSCMEVRALCDDLSCALDRLPEKAAAEAIQAFLSVIHSIVVQQIKEQKLKNKSDRLETKLEKKLNSLRHSDKHIEHTTGALNHDPVTKDDTMLEALKRRVEEERLKYLDSVRTSRAMTLNNLQRGLPNVFRALTRFAGLCVQAFEGISGSGDVPSSQSEAATSPLLS